MYNEYKRARDSAWSVLTDNKIVSFPFSVTALLEKHSIKYFSFDEAQEIFEAYGIRPTGEAFSIKLNESYYVFYNSEFKKVRLRFTLAHELGHILLGHVSNDKSHLSEYEENEANIFASRLLMPAIVMHLEGLNAPEEIAKFFGVSLEAAKIRSERMLVLRERNSFKASGLERIYASIYLEGKKQKRDIPKQ